MDWDDLRVTLPSILVSYLITPILADFTRAYPGIELDLAVFTEAFNLTKREADTAIRITNEPPEQLIGRHLMQYAKSVYASVGYLVTHDLSNPSSCTWIGWEECAPKPWWVK